MMPGISAYKNHSNSVYVCLCRYPWLPCLHVGNKDRTIYLPMEFCQIVQGQKHNKKLSDEQTANMIKETAKRPRERQRLIEDIVSIQL